MVMPAGRFLAPAFGLVGGRPKTGAAFRVESYAARRVGSQRTERASFRSLKRTSAARFCAGSLNRSGCDVSARHRNARLISVGVASGLMPRVA